MFTADHTLGYADSLNSSNLWNKVVGSGIYLAIAWVLMNYLSSGVSALFAWSLDFTPHFSLNGLSSLAGTSGWCGTYVAMVFATAPIFAIAVSLVAWIAFSLASPFQTHFRTFLFWLAVVGFIIYYGHIVAGLIYLATGIPRLFMGFVAMYTWARWETETITAVLIIQAALSLIWPLLLVPRTAEFSPSTLLLDPTNQSRLFLFVFATPLLVGSALMLAASFPLNLHYLVIQLFVCSIVAAIGYMGFLIFQNPTLQVVKGGLTARSSVFYIALIVGLIAFARLALSIPIKSFI